MNRVATIREVDPIIATTELTVLQAKEGPSKNHNYRVLMEVDLTTQNKEIRWCITDNIRFQMINTIGQNIILFLHDVISSEKGITSN